MESVVALRETEAAYQSYPPANERCYAILLRQDDG